MISKHKIIDKDCVGDYFGAIVLAQGSAGRSQKIFHIIEYINQDPNPKWYLGKFVYQRDQAKDGKGLVSDTVEDLCTIPGEVKNPEKIFEEYPEYFL